MMLMTTKMAGVVSPLPVLYGERARVRGGRAFEFAAALHPGPLPIPSEVEWGEGDV